MGETENEVEGEPDGEAQKKVEKAPPTPPSLTGCHFIVVPDNSEAAPERYTVNDLAELQSRLYGVLDRMECGWCWVFVNGEPCKLHLPRQVFVLELPDGTSVALRPAGEEPVSVDGSFHTLRPIRNV